MTVILKYGFEYKGEDYMLYVCFSSDCECVMYTYDDIRILVAMLYG